MSDPELVYWIGLHLEYLCGRLQEIANAIAEILQVESKDFTRVARIRNWYA
jgi:hypothetical protein